jgi:hypothetical protein
MWLVQLLLLLLLLLLLILLFLLPLLFVIVNLCLDTFPWLIGVLCHCVCLVSYVYGHIQCFYCHRWSRFCNVSKSPLVDIAAVALAPIASVCVCVRACVHACICNLSTIQLTGFATLCWLLCAVFRWVRVRVRPQPRPATCSTLQHHAAAFIPLHASSVLVTDRRYHSILHHGVGYLDTIYIHVHFSCPWKWTKVLIN